MAALSEQLRDAAVLWVLDGRFDRVVEAAVACLVGGESCLAVDILAGSSPSDPYSERLEMVAAALDGLGLPALPTDPDEVARQSAGIITRTTLSGALSRDDGDTWLVGSLTCDARARLESVLGEP